MLDVVAGLSRKFPEIVPLGIVESEVEKPPKAACLLPTAVPASMVVESLSSLKLTRLTVYCCEPFTLTNTNILLVALLGVMLTERPVISINDVLVVVNVSVFVVLTTCNTVPGDPVVTSVPEAAGSVSV